MKAILLFLPIVLGLPTLAEAPRAVGEARRALSEGIPQVAIVKLQAALKARDFPTPERPEALRLLAEAQLASADPEAALVTLRPLTDIHDNESRLLRAHSYAATGQWDEALPLYQELNGQPGVPSSAAIGEAECLQARGRTTEAVATLEKLVSNGHATLAAKLRLASLLVELTQPREARTLLATLPDGTAGESKWRGYIEARLLLLEKKPKEALLKVESILADPVGLSPELAAASTLAGAEAQLALTGPDAAEKALESFIGQNPNSPQLEVVFRRLDQIYKLDKSPTERPLHDIIGKYPGRTAALARFYVARLQLRQGYLDKAHKSLADFVTKFPTHELIPYVHEMQADVELTRGKIAETRGSFTEAQRAFINEAEKALDRAIESAQTGDLKARFSLRAALINLLYQREFDHAATRLREAGKVSQFRQIAAYNAALSWLMLQNYPRFREDLTAFAAQFSAPLLLGHLRLEEGLMLARGKSPKATQIVEDFLHDFPRHPRQDEGRLALAEIAFQEGRTEDAAALAQSVKGTPETAEQSDYLAISLEDKKRSRDPAKVIKLARKFIADHPQSHLLTDVRMKLGQVYFTNDDYLRAQEQFDALAKEAPTSEYAETALFLAGQCGTKIMNREALDAARDFFEQVAVRKGPLAAHARLQQAGIKNKLGDYDAAAKICESIVGLPGLDPEIRAAALIGKGDNLVAAFEKDAPAEPVPGPAGKTPGALKPAVPNIRDSYLTQAIAAYDTLLATPNLAPLWRNQAAYKKGRPLRQLNRPLEALAVFHDILEQTEAAYRKVNGGAPGGDNTGEIFWFAKAGADAARLLQDMGKWEAAIQVYKKLAGVPGPHRTEAEQQVKRLRAEHFIWD